MPAYMPKPNMAAAKISVIIFIFSDVRVVTGTSVSSPHFGTSHIPFRPRFCGKWSHSQTPSCGCASCQQSGFGTAGVRRPADCDTLECTLLAMTRKQLQHLPEISASVRSEERHIG